MDTTAADSHPEPSSGRNRAPRRPPFAKLRADQLDAIRESCPPACFSSAVLAYVALLRLGLDTWRSGHGVVSATEDAIGAAVGISGKTVRRVVPHLVKAGVIDSDRHDQAAKRRDRRPAVYTVHALIATDMMSVEADSSTDTESADYGHDVRSSARARETRPFRKVEVASSASRVDGEAVTSDEEATFQRVRAVFSERTGITCPESTSRKTVVRGRRRTHPDLDLIALTVFVLDGWKQGDKPRHLGAIFGPDCIDANVAAYEAHRAPKRSSAASFVERHQ